MPTLAQLQSLHAATRAAAQRFTTYNFHAYFVRRADEAFAPALASMGDTKTIPASFLEAARRGGANEKMSESELDEFVRNRTHDLEVLKRAGTINSMYSGEKLVVEMPKGDSILTRSEN